MLLNILNYGNFKALIRVMTIWIFVFQGFFFLSQHIVINEVCLILIEKKTIYIL